MIVLTFVPQFGRDPGSYRVTGEVLTVNGRPFDLSFVAEGESVTILPEPGEEHVFAGPVRRSGGVIHAEVIGWVGDGEGTHPVAPVTVEAEGEIEPWPPQPPVPAADDPAEGA